jgi:hypothetical protein
VPPLYVVQQLKNMPTARNCKVVFDK